ncbi:MAG TPA: low temperature requirement protein A [Acidobacteriota bacterium]
MSNQPLQSEARRHSLIKPMVARSPDQAHRTATPLELFFDLVFVVAIAQAAGRFHHAIADDHAAQGLLSYGMVFFAIWWAWMNFTWFASAYDNDDVAYRLLVFVQLSGALVLAAGVSRSFDTLDFTVPTLGYVVMRAAMVSQWLRAGRGDPPRRRTAHRYALGIGICQAGWVGLLFVPPQWYVPGFFLLAAGELLVPIWAEQAGATPWHCDHIVERYALFTIIVLGESILAASVAIRTAAEGETANGDLASISGGGILIVFSLWWLYFARPQRDLRDSLRTAFVWGYGHLPIYASAAAVGAGIAVAVDQRTGDTAIGPYGAGAAVAVPVAVFLISLWALHVRPGSDGPMRLFFIPVFSGLILLAPLTAHAVLVTGLLTAALLAAKLITARRMAAG